MSMDREAHAHGASCRASSGEQGNTRARDCNARSLVAFDITVVTWLERFYASFLFLARVQISICVLTRYKQDHCVYFNVKLNS